MDIREVEPDDYNQFIALFKEFFEYAGNEDLEDQEMKKIWDNALNEKKNYVVFCAVVGPELVGIVSITLGESSYKAAPFAWCDDLYVKKDYRSRGIGKALMLNVTEYCHIHGCSNVLLGVGQDEHNVKSFYKSLGYQEMQNTLLTLPLKID